MAIYVALLRGINIGGNILKMERLREVCAELGAKNVRTYVQSGNVVFEAAGSASQWEQKLEKRLAGESRLPPSVMVRTAAEIAKVAAGNPFLKEKGMDTTRLAVTFLQRAPRKGGAGGVGSAGYWEGAVSLRGKRVLFALSGWVCEGEVVWDGSGAGAKDYDAELEHGEEALRDVWRVGRGGICHRGTETQRKIWDWKSGRQKIDKKDQKTKKQILRRERRFIMTTLGAITIWISNNRGGAGRGRWRVFGLCRSIRGRSR